MSSGFTYTNRKGQTYHLCAVPGKSGKTRLVFAREPRGQPVSEMPDGYEVAESVNGQVSVRKAVPPRIAEAEVDRVRETLDRHQRLAAYRVDAVKDAVVVYEPQGAVDPQRFRSLGVDPEVIASLERSCRYSPVFRFVLIEPASRRFAAERMCYRGRMEGWLSLHTAGPIGTLADGCLKHLGKDSFFELY